MSENPGMPFSMQPSSMNTLRRVYQPKPLNEQCDLCSIELRPEHAHLMDPQTRQILCACDACALLFSTRQGTRFRRIPSRVRYLTGFQMADTTWEGLMIPVGMALFFYNSQAEKMTAYYPSPAGATESLLSLDAWDGLVSENPVLGEMEIDVEALLVNRLKEAREYYLVPIDKCYELVGLIRVHWHGLSGGAQVWDEIEAFFKALKRRSGFTGQAPPGEQTHA